MRVNAKACQSLLALLVVQYLSALLQSESQLKGVVDHKAQVCVFLDVSPYDAIDIPSPERLVCLESVLGQ